MKQFVQPKHPGEMPDTSRISKAAKVRPEDIKVKAEVRDERNQIQRQAD